MRLLCGSLLILSLLACQGKESPKNGPADPVPPDDVKPIPTDIAQGHINGQVWTFQSGRAVIRNKWFKQYLEVSLWNENVDSPCDVQEGSILAVIVSTPRKVATWEIDPFTSNAGVFFVDRNFNPHPRDNLRAESGSVTISSIEKYMAAGYFSAEFNNPKVGTTAVSGRFEVPICSSLDAVYGDNFSSETP